jgi:hypothetical protein
MCEATASWKALVSSLAVVDQPLGLLLAVYLPRYRT